MIYICIVTHNREAALKRLLWSPHFTEIEGSEGPAVIVLDQASTDGTPAILREWTERSCRYRVVRSEQQVSGGAARQRLVDLLTSDLRIYDVLVFLDDDVEAAQSGWLGRLLDPFARAEVLVSGANGRIVTRDWLTLPGEGQAIDYVGGGWMAVRATAFLKAGIEWSHDYPNTYYEDVDFCLQVTALGTKVWNCGDVGLRHEHGITSALQSEWVARNREICRRKWTGRGLVLHETAPEVNDA